MAEPARENSAETAPVVGRPFVKGQSGNPKGRPRGLASATRDVLKRAVAEGEDPSLVLARFWAGILADTNQKIEVRMQASDRLAERGWGKAPVYAPIEDEDPLGMTDQDLDEAVGRFDAEVVRLAVAPGAGSAANGDGAESEPQR